MRLAFVVAHAGRRCRPMDAVRPSGVCRGDDLVGVVTGQDHHTWIVHAQPTHRGASILSFPRSTLRWSNIRNGGSLSIARASSSRARSGILSRTLRGVV